MSHRVVLFCEDAAHESLARALVARLAREESVSVSIHVGSARFGISRVKRELRAFEQLLQRGSGLPDLLVILVDANAAGVASRRSEIEDAIDLASFPRAVVGVPDPMVECWYLADPASFAERFGRGPAAASAHDDKQRLIAALEDAGEIVVSGGAEFADEIVEAMDLYRAGRNAATLKSFIDDLSATLRQL